MREWLESLEPILNEFVKAANGKPNQGFWQSMVRTKPLDKITRRSCTPQEPTKFDGWILNFFPNEDGVTPTTTTVDSKFPSQLSSVSLKYQIVSESTKHVIDSYNFELWAGFIGAEKDETNHFIMPKIGWIIRYSTKKEAYE